MVSVEIEYCVPCGHLSRAQTLQEQILETYGQAVDGVRLKTGDGGVFRVSVDGELVFDKSEDEYDPDAILDAVDTAIGTPA